jgi:IS1 family transposase
MKLHDKLVQGLIGGVYEIDETWGYVGRHERRKLKTDPSWFGDQYTMFAMEADTKLVPSYQTGKRTLPVATRFMRDLRARVEGMPQLTFDGWPHWIEATRRTFGHEGAHVGMTVKEYQKECRPDDTSKGCGRVKSQKKTVVFGKPKQHRISTSKAERYNLTSRMTDRRLTRLTNGYSKKAKNHAASAALHVFWYNFVRVHETLGTTPAVSAGIAAHEWTIEEMAHAALAEMGRENPEPKGTRPRRYQRKTHERDVVDPVIVRRGRWPGRATAAPLGSGSA